MSPSPGDAPSSPDSSRPSGLASVFKGLTGAKLTKSPPPSLKSASSILSPIADHVNATRTTLSGWSPNHMESLQVLRNGNGSVGERVAAADSLRFAVAEHPMNPVLEIWDVAKTMIASNKSDAERIAGWELLSECVKHKASTDLERQSFFETLKAPAHANDFHLQLAAVEDLTAHGRDLSGFDYQVIPQLEVWLREAYQAVKAARKQASRDAKKNAGKARFSAAGEEKNLHQLFKFIGDIIKFSSNVANEKSMTDLMKVLVAVCLTTTIEEDLKASINVIDTIVTFGALPTASFKECVLVLGSIFCLVPSLSKIAWHTISILLKSHNGPAAVRVLVDLLRNLPADGTSKGKDTRDIRGVLAVLEKLLTKSTEKGYPPVPFALLLDGLVAAVHSTDSGRVHCAVLKLINSLFRDGAGNIHHLIVEEDWSTLLNIAAECSKKAPSGILVNSEMVALANEPDRPDGAIGIELLKLITRLEELAAQKSGDFIPRQIIIRFFIDIHTRLPDSAARCVLTYFQEFRCCSPSDLQWEENLALVLKEFYANRSRSSETRLLSLQAVTESYDMLDLIGEGLGDDDCVPNLIKDLLNNIADETNLLVLESVVAFMVSVAVSSDLELFNYITDTLRTIVVNDRLLSPIASSASRPTTPVGGETVTPPKSYTSSGVVTRGYVKLFMRCMNLDGPKTLKLFDTLVNIAKTSHCKTDARLTAMKLLFRLRADWANRVFLISDTESDGLAAALLHTASSRAKKHSEDASQPSRPSRADMGAVSRSTRGISFSSSGTQERVFPIRSASGAKSSYPYKQLWALPDPEALPESPSAIASPILVSFVEDLEPEATEEGEPSAVETKQIALNMDSWLNTIVRIIESGSEWEIYSMVLVHLPSQLTNHAIFRSAVPQIQELRRVTCEQIRTNNFQEPPNSTSLRRADVAICLFHTLTMILSYHEYFQKEQEDEIVQAFVKGISTWERCAKYCIHALSICCHELPLSTSKTLVQMLQKMAQIITQPHVAMHILEFLACLSRMQNLYVNFREDEYRIVFGICVRYLQYVRDKKQTQRGSLHSETATPTGSTSDLLHPNAADDLPQYVYALAYHVITFWFLALKLPDRANHVGWIAKNLLSDVDGGQNPEEQALVTLDFMQRVAYADADESSEDLLFTKERFGEILKRRWLMGNSIVTIEQSTTTGWSQITKRQPSGTSSYIVHENFRPRPAHQAQYISDVSRDGQVTNNNILPSHLMVQLMTSTPQTQDTARPIPLPNDEPTQRTVRLFDRNSTVDGHKVGVVYIGEGQTQETEILANVSGSSDYVAFLNGLGALTRLKGSKFNTQGLDREYDTDGEYTFCWRDKVTEMVFHVITQMPTNLERDPQVIMKKRHIGNDFVNIIFNDSGMPFRFDTFPSEFNYVNIVITPEARASFLTIRENPPSEGKHPPFYKVQVMSKPGFPEISPASETKMVSLRALPGFIRPLALNASVFCLVWANREGGEHVSSWRNRLREIKKLRDKHGPKNNTAGTHQSSHPHLSHLNSISTPSPPPSSLGGAVLGNNHLITQGADASKSAANVRDSFSSLRRSSVATFFTSTSEQTSHRSSMLSTTTNDTEVSPANGLDALVESVDFSKWA